MIPQLSKFYQLGFVASDLDMALSALQTRFGIRQFRRKRAADWLETAHAWTSDVMIEVMKIGETAPPIYAGYAAQDGAAIRLHHHGYRVPDLAAWREIERRVTDAALPIPVKGIEMGGNLHFMYVDTRAELGIYSEFVMLRGAASTLYDDVPRN